MYINKNIQKNISSCIQILKIGQTDRRTFNFIYVEKFQAFMVFSVDLKVAITLNISSVRMIKHFEQIKWNKIRKTELNQ